MASALTPLTRPFSSQYFSTPAAFATLIFDTPGSADEIGGADICALAACGHASIAAMQASVVDNFRIAASIKRRPSPELSDSSSESLIPPGQTAEPLSHVGIPPVRPE